MFNPITALKALKTAYDAKNNTKELVNEFKKGDNMNKDKAYSIGLGLWKALKYLLTYALGAGVCAASLDSVSLPDSLSQFAGDWPAYAVGIAVALWKVGCNYYKQQKTTTSTT